MKYRIEIEIEERNSGEKRYTPQVGIPILKIGRFDFFSTRWSNIIRDNTSCYHSTYVSYSYYTEQDALEVIEEYKKYLIAEKVRETKKITHKIVE